MARQQTGPRRYPEIEQRGPGRSGSTQSAADIFGDEEETMPLRGGDLGAEHPASLGTAPQGGRDAGERERHDSEAARETFADGEPEPTRQHVAAGRFDRDREHSAWRVQRNWDEDRYGYPEATSYQREMHRGRTDYEPAGRFATQREQGAGSEAGRYREGWCGGDRRAGHGRDIGEGDHRPYGGRADRGSGYGVMDEYDTAGLWRGDASQNGRGDPAGNPSAARRGRYARQGPKGYSRSDERIHEDVCERLYHADDVDVADVSVRVQDRVVTLEGTVPERWMKHRIEDLCDAASGVRDVDNRVRINRSGTPDSPSRSV